MKYLITSYEHFGILEEVDNLKGEFEVIGEKDIIAFTQKRKPHLVNFDGQRAYTKKAEELAKFVYNIKGSYKNYRLIFIPVEEGFING